MTADATAWATAVERQRQVIRALDIAVDDARAQVDRDVDLLRAAVRERERARVHLEHLIEMQNERADA